MSIYVSDFFIFAKYVSVYEHSNYITWNFIFISGKYVFVILSARQTISKWTVRNAEVIEG